MVPFWPDAELGKACLWHVHTLLSTGDSLFVAVGENLFIVENMCNKLLNFLHI